jgi:hypothetical protein
MKYSKNILILGIGLLVTARNMAQVKKIQTQAPLPALYDALNKPSGNQTVYRAQINLPPASGLPGYEQLTPGCSGNDCQDISIRYEVPGFVMLDRILLAGTLHNKIAGLLDEQEQWQNMSASQVSDQTRQQMVNLIQQQIDNLQNLEDNLANGCQPIDFAGYSTRIYADVRFNDPVLGPMGLMRANGSGDLNVSDLFNGIPYSALDGSPVKATLLIYKK